MIQSAAWLPLALLAAVFAALTAILAKIGLEGIDADYATLLRTLFISVVLAVFVTVTGKWENPALLPRRAVVFLLLSALATGASWVFYFRALKVGDASRVAPIDKLSVVLVAVLGVSVLGERLSLRDWAGIAMIAGGALLLAIKR